MRVILATDAIFPPLTGIGRYASELATRLPQHPNIESLRYFGMWMWRGTAASSQQDAPLTPPSVPPALARMRRYFADRTWAVSAYDVVSERWRAQLLRRAGEGPHPAVYHSPNFFLPDYAGPSVVTVHDLSIDRFPETHNAAQRHYYTLAFRRSLERATAVLTDSEAIRTELLAGYGLTAERVTAIPLGVDAIFHPRDTGTLQMQLQSLGLKPGGYVLSVSTLEPRKRLDQLIRAYSLLPPTLRQRWPLVLVGAHGWLNSHLRPLMEQGQAQGWLRYLGYVPQQQLPLIYAGAHGFAMVSVYEGFGLPLLEAMASGVPVLTSDRSCMPEVTAGAALLVNPDDVQSIAIGLQRLLEDTAWRMQATAQGLRRAQALSWQRCIDATVGVYRQVAGES